MNPEKIFAIIVGTWIGLGIIGWLIIITAEIIDKNGTDFRTLCKDDRHDIFHVLLIAMIAGPFSIYGAIWVLIEERRRKKFLDEINEQLANLAGPEDEIDQ